MGKTKKEVVNAKALLILLPIITLAVLPSINDFTVLPKNILLVIAAGVCLISILTEAKKIFTIANSRFWLPAIVFIGVIVGLSALSDFKFKSFFGEYGRYNGGIQYSALAILFLYTVFFFKNRDAIVFLYALAIVGFITSLLGIAQKLGFDIVGYAGDSREVAATFGNSNFASAFMGISTAALLYTFFISRKVWLRALIIFAAISNLFAIIASNSSQGIFAILIEFFIFTAFFIYNKKQKMIYPYLVLGFIGILAVVFGLLQKGPLAQFIYQASTTYRGNYYRAGIAMFKDHPLTGIGIDRFGDFYRTYRDFYAISNSGTSGTTNYAHNILIQFAATGGLILLLSFVVLSSSVYVSFGKDVKNILNEKDILKLSLLAIWAAYCVVSLVSIDELGLATWGWVSGGAVIALTKPTLKVSGSTIENIGKKYIAQTTKFVFLIICLALYSPILQADAAYKRAISTMTPESDSTFIKYLDENSSRAYALNRHEINYAIANADTKFRIGQPEKAISILREAISINPQSYPAMMTLAQLFRVTGGTKNEIEIRERIKLIDPLGWENQERLVELYTSVGELVNAEKLKMQLQKYKGN